MLIGPLSGLPENTMRAFEAFGPVNFIPFFVARIPPAGIFEDVLERHQRIVFPVDEV